MLCQFIVKNYKSYRDETIFDFQAENIDEHSDSLLYDEGDSKAILPVSVIYGPNGGGKSGMIEALKCLFHLIDNPITMIRGDKKGQPINTPNRFTLAPFLFNKKSPTEPTEFTVYFRTKGYEYKYMLFLYKDNIVSEGLYKRKIGGKRSATLFVRNESGVTLGAIIRKGKINKDVNPNMPYLSLLIAFYDIKDVNNVGFWFWLCSACFSLMDTPDYYLMQPLENDSDGFAMFFDKKVFLQIVKEIDIPIDDYYIKGDIDKTESNPSGKVYTVHKKNGEHYHLNLQEESLGTQKLFRTLAVALFALMSGGLLLIDELDAGLHPKLLSYIVKLFKNKKINNSNAQLLFTSHDVTTMKSDLFRRDEIWFAAKDDDGASEIYSLYDIRDVKGKRIRANVAFDKEYMLGKYGADPYLTNILSEEWRGWS